MYKTTETMHTVYLTSDTPSLPPSAVTVGFFDGVHRGHQYLIDQLKETAARQKLVSALVTFTTHPRQILQSDYQPQLLSTPDEKLSLLAATGIDYLVVMPFSRETAQLSARDFMVDVLSRRLHARALITGYDNRFGHNRSEGFDDYVRYGRETAISVSAGKPLMLNGVSVSSSLVRTFLKAGNIEAANNCLGRCYTLTGIVVKGHQVGRELGFPTANVKPDMAEKLIPAPGVYGVKVHIDGAMAAWPAMMNIGRRPTFYGTDETLEANIFGYDGDLYGHHITIDFLFRHREEQRFDTPAQLARQLSLDANAIQEKIYNL